MIKLKSGEEIAVMKEGGARLKKVVSELIPKIKVGVTTDFIDKEAERLIIKNGGSSSFKKVQGYHWSTCLPINEQVVHTPPAERTLKNGDVLTVDIGMYFKGYHTDYSDTFVVGKTENKDTLKFLETGRTALRKAIEQAKAGKRLGDISETIEKEITRNGYAITKELTGHGIGKDLHEDPFIPGYLDMPKDKTYMLRPGLVIAIEVIYAMGTGKIAYEKGIDWSIVSADGSLTACFEHTVAITKKNTLILT